MFNYFDPKDYKSGLRSGSDADCGHSRPADGHVMFLWSPTSVCSAVVTEFSFLGFL